MERQVFKPAEAAHGIMEQNSNLCLRFVARRARAIVSTEEDEGLSCSLLSLPHQGKMFNLFEGNSAALWARCASKLPAEPLKFCSYCFYGVTSNKFKSL